MSALQLTKLPKPNLLEAVSFESILARRKERFLSLIESKEKKAEWKKQLQLESEPVVKLLEESAYLELLLRERVNDVAVSNMIAFAKGSDLDHLVANYAVKRLVIRKEDLTTSTPTPAIYETDESLRERALQAFEGLTNAGTVGAYKYHAFSADARVVDVGVSLLKPGTVLVSILSNEKSNPVLVSQDLIKTVYQHLSAEDVRPLTDTVQVKAALAVNYEIKAKIKTITGVAGGLTQQNISDALTTLVQTQKIGQDITRSQIIKTLHQEGVYSVELLSPKEDIKVDSRSVAICTSHQYEMVGDDA